MTPKEFVGCWANEKQLLLTAYLSGSEATGVGNRINSMNLNSKQRQEMAMLVDDILTDVFYTLLLGLDGCAQIGGTQLNYRLMDEAGNELTGKGQIEAEAWKKFQESRK